MCSLRVLLALFAALAAFAEEPVFLDKVRLEAGGGALAPLRTSAPYVVEIQEGNRRLAFADGEVIARDGAGKELWRAKTPDGARVVRLASDASTLYFQAFPSKGSDPEPIADTRIDRLGLEKGTWLDPLVAPRPSASRESDIVSLLAVRADGGDVYAAVESFNGERGNDCGQSRGWIVSKFEKGATKPAWSTEFTPGGEAGGTTLLLMAASYPTPATAQPSGLNRLGDALIVCPSRNGPLAGLDAKTGKEIWKLEKPWELRRMFEGPSVWAHSLSHREYKEETGWILGGPAIVTRPGKHKGDDPTQSIFIAVARGPKNGYEELCADCVVFEVNTYGQVLTMSPLPRCVEGRSFASDDGGLVWAGQNNSLARLSAADPSVAYAMGPGGPDRIGRVAWYREFAAVAAAEQAWVRSDPAWKSWVFTGKRAFRMASGGYTGVADKKLYSFALAAVDNATGEESLVTLQVPLQKEIDPDECHNGGSEHYPDGTIYYHLSGPWRVGITGLQVLGEELRVVIGGEEWSGAADFSLAEVVKLAEKPGK